MEMDGSPRMTPGETRTVKLSLHANPLLRETHKFQLRLLLPDGWTAPKYPRTMHLLYPQAIHELYGDASVEFEIKAGENVEPVNRAYVEVVSPDLAYPMMVPVIFIG